jgi:hypothetical protein
LDSLDAIIERMIETLDRSMTMAKKKVDAVPPLKSKGRPKLAAPKPPTPIAMTIRGGQEWQDWLDGVCEAVRKEKGLGKIDRTVAVDVALRLLAEKLGLPEPPDRY